MSNIFNLQRDLFWGNTQSGVRTFGSTSAFGDTVNANSSGNIQPDTQVGNIRDSVTNAAGNWSAAGVILEPPLESNTPYRVKAYVEGPAEKYIVVGYAPDVPTGTNDQIDSVTRYPLDGYYFDECIALLKPSGGFADRPVFFGIAVGEASALRCGGMLSVQRLSTVTPSIISSVS